MTITAPGNPDVPWPGQPRTAPAGLPADSPDSITALDRIDIEQAKRKLRNLETAKRELQAEQAAAATRTAAENASANPLLDSRGYVDWEAAFSAAPEDVPWIVGSFIEEGMTHALWGVPGHGKSLFALETVVHHVIGTHPVLYVDSENHLLRVIVPRLKSFGMTPGKLAGLHMRSFTQFEPFDTPAGGDQLLGYALETGARLVVIDTTSRFLGGDENSADTFLRFYNHTLMKLKRHDVASLRLDHPGKDTARGTRGSSAKYGDIDYEYSIEDPEDGTTPYRKLTCTKSRTGDGLGKGEAIMLRKHGVTGPGSCFWHEWEPETARGDSSARDLSGQLDRLGVPRKAGRPTARKALDTAGIKVSNAQLEAAIRYRKNCPGQSAGSPGSSASLTDCPPAPLTSAGSRAAPAPDTGDAPAPWPPCEHPGCWDARRGCCLSSPTERTAS